MKKITSIFVGFLIATNLSAQSPEKISYQAVVRDASTTLVTNQQVGVQISILQGSASGSAVYVETQMPTTNANGLISIEIGSGTVVSGNFSSINWANNIYFIKTETDPNGGTNYTITGVSQLLSVPYALHAKTADSIVGVNGLNNGSAIGVTPYWDGNTWVTNSTNLYNNGNVVGIGTTTPHSSSILDVQSNNKGFLPPRMTQAQRNAITNPEAGLIIYCTDCFELQLYNGSSWVALTAGVPNQMPYTSYVILNGYTLVGHTLTGTHSYYDADNDPQGTSIYKWYRADDISGTNQVQIIGETTTTYNLQAADDTYYIALSVTPIAQTGFNPGLPVMSDFVGPIAVNTVPSVMNPTTGKLWMDRNLGASNVATSSTDASAYGDLYQWGRGSDGHQLRTSNTTTTLSTTDNPGHGDFIINPNTNPYGWRSPGNANLWQVSTGVNNPCPSGFRVPTLAEWNAERVSWNTNNAAGALASPLKLTLGGERDPSGALINVNTQGFYWANGGNTTHANYLFISTTSANNNNSDYHGYGHSVRCIRE